MYASSNTLSNLFMASLHLDFLLLYVNSSLENSVLCIANPLDFLRTQKDIIFEEHPVHSFHYNRSE